MTRPGPLQTPKRGRAGLTDLLRPLYTVVDESDSDLTSYTAQSAAK
jgi:hypothetical protein